MGRLSLASVIVLMRHGQTAHNHEGRFQGRIDAILDDTGIRQSESAAQALLEGRFGRSFEGIYTSSLQRASLTADIVACSLGMEAIRLPELMEIDCGRISGLSISEAREKFPEAMDRFSDGWWHHKYPDGQSHAMYEKENVLPAIRKIAAFHPEGTVLAVTHGGFIRTAVLNCLGLRGERPFLRQKLDNCGLTTIEVTELGEDGGIKARLLEFNACLSGSDSSATDVYTKEGSLR